LGKEEVNNPNDGGCMEWVSTERGVSVWQKPLLGILVENTIGTWGMADFWGLKGHLVGDRPNECENVSGLTSNRPCG